MLISERAATQSNYPLWVLTLSRDWWWGANQLYLITITASHDALSPRGGAWCPTHPSLVNEERSELYFYSYIPRLLRGMWCKNIRKSHYYGFCCFFTLYLLFPPPFVFHILFSREIRRLPRAAFQRMKYLSSERGVAHCSKLILSDQSQGTCQCQEPQRDETHSCTDTVRHAAAWHSTRGSEISIQTAKGSQVNEFLCEKREAVSSFFGFIVKLKRKDWHHVGHRGRSAVQSSN